MDMLSKGDIRRCLQALRETSHTLSGILQEPEIIQVLLEQIVSVFEAQGAVLHLLSPDGDALTPAGALGLRGVSPQQSPIQVAHSQIDQRVLDGEVVIIPDVSHEPGFQQASTAGGEGRWGLVAVPLSVRERVIGVLRLYMDEVAGLSPEDILLLNTMTELGALALEKVHLHRSLYRIAEALNTSLELQPMLKKVLEATVQQMGLKAASIRLLDPRRQILRLVVAYGLSETYLAKGDIHVDKSPVDQRVLQDEVVVLYDIEHDTGFEYPEEATKEGIRSVLVSSVKLKDRPLGVMRVYSAQPRRFGPVAVGFLTSVADLVALAIENAELYATLQSRYADLKLDLAEWYRFLALS